MSSPEASFGRYFDFCSSLPNKTIGKEPIPTCAPCVMEKPPAGDNFSAINAEEILSSPSPSYSSGTSAASRPNSPAVFNKRTECSNSWFSRFSTTGSTSFCTNSVVVWAIIFCSSVKSSGVITRLISTSSIKKPPPLIMFVVCSIVNILP